MPTRLLIWQRGVAVEAPDHPGMRLHLWFYEWNMFGAVEDGQHTQGRRDFDWEMIEPDKRARTDAHGFSIEAEAVDDGAKLSLTVTNRTDRPWPEIAGIIPCFNPGLEGSSEVENREFLDIEHTRTWFVGNSGLERLEQREIHFNQRCRGEIDAQAKSGEYEFSHKWPTSERDARAGLLIRESADGVWVGGIAWDRFLSAQGHNPWRCMHLCIRVGPLAPGDSRTLTGRIYLFQGNKAACLERFRREFASGSGEWTVDSGQ